MMVSFSQRSFTISRSPMSSSVVMRKDRVVLLFRSGLRGGGESNQSVSLGSIKASVVCERTHVCDARSSSFGFLFLVGVVFNTVADHLL